MDLACLDEDVKLSANGRRPTLFPSLSFYFYFLTNTYPIHFHDAYFYYTVGVVLCFLGQAFLHFPSQTPIWDDNCICPDYRATPFERYPWQGKMWRRIATVWTLGQHRPDANSYYDNYVQHKCSCMDARATSSGRDPNMVFREAHYGNSIAQLSVRTLSATVWTPPREIRESIYFHLFPYCISQFRVQITTLFYLTLFKTRPLCHDRLNLRNFGLVILTAIPLLLLLGLQIILDPWDIFWIKNYALQKWLSNYGIAFHLAIYGSIFIHWPLS